MLHKQSGHPSRVSGFVYADMECPHPPAEDYATHWRGAGTDDCQWQKYHQCQPQPIRSELPSGQSRLHRLRNRGSTPLCSTRKPCRTKPARFFHTHFQPIGVCRFCTEVFGDFLKGFLSPCTAQKLASGLKTAFFLVMEVAGLFWGRFWLLMR